ncbi:MAG: cadmium-translocating P-type ATPase, partial [Ruminococcus sp.]|nr:cadmium-translocating P-type ATPase [Ruminococcus sp.]
ISGVKSVIKLKLDETTLMTVAVIAAFCLGQFVEGAMVTILFGIGELLEDKAVENSRRSIEKLANIQSDEAIIIENGNEKTVDADDVKIGTEIIIKPFAKIPLDCVVIDGKSNVDTSAITGESMPMAAEVGTELLSGMVNGESLIKAKTTKAYEDSTASRIIKLVEDASITKSKNEKLITRFAGVYTPIVILISLAIAFIPPIFLGNISEWIYRGLVCLVASCPCAIVISVPLSYYSGIGAASKYGVLFKGGRYLEALAKADAIAFDKTGTLTEGKLTIEKIIPFENYGENDLLKIAASVEKNSTHPIARAIVESYNGDFLKMDDYSEQSGLGVSAVYDGKIVKCVSKRIFEKEPEVKADAYLIYDGELIGAFKLKDKVRAEVNKVIGNLKKQGVNEFVLLTGDSKENAEKACKEISTINKCCAELVPEDKLNIVNELKDKKKGVAFVGDGINDAPVIAAADCGFAMGLGSDAAISSADAVLTSGNLTALPKAFKIAKKTVMTVKTNIAFALFIKALVIILAFFGMAAIWMSVIADVGVCLLCVLYATRLLKIKI